MDTLRGYVTSAVPICSGSIRAAVRAVVERQAVLALLARI
jgi:hypothetical protein